MNHQCSLDELKNYSVLDINPQIYLRLARPLKDDVTLDTLDLDKFYERTNYNGISINMTPDYGFNESSSVLLTKNSQLYADFKKSLSEVDSLTDSKLI